MKELTKAVQGFLTELAYQRSSSSVGLLDHDSEYAGFNAKHDECYEALKAMLGEKEQHVLVAFDDAWSDMAAREGFAAYKRGFMDAQRLCHLLTVANFAEDMDDKKAAASDTGESA